MKKPRIEDFDPNALPTLGSPLEGMPSIEAPPGNSRTRAKQAAQATVMPLKRPADEQPPTAPSLGSTAPTQPTQTAETSEDLIRSSVRTPVRPLGSPPGRRTITRYAFELYQDQIEMLKGFSLEEKLRGEKGSMSEMVREALDAYLAKRNRTEGE